MAMKNYLEQQLNLMGCGFIEADDWKRNWLNRGLNNDLVNDIMKVAGFLDAVYFNACLTYAKDFFILEGDGKYLDSYYGSVPLAKNTAQDLVKNVFPKYQWNDVYDLLD